MRQEPGKRSTSLYVVRRDGGGLQRLTRGDQVVAMPAWRGDGLLLAYAASPLAGGSFDIWTVDPAGGKPQRVVTGAAEQIAPSFTRDGKVTFRIVEPGEPFPEKTSDSGTPLVGPRELLPDFDQRAPFRLTHRRHEARLRLGDRQHRRRAGVDPRQPPGRRRDRCARSSSSGCRTAPSAPTTTRAASATRPRPRTRTGTCSTSSATSSGRSRASSSCATGRAASASPTTTGSPGGASRSSRGGHFYGNCDASNPRALSVEQGTSIGFTDLYPAHFHGQNLELRGVPAGIYVLVHRANPTLQLEEIDYTNNAASLRIRLSWSGGAPHVETLRRCEGSADC